MARIQRTTSFLRQGLQDVLLQLENYHNGSNSLNSIENRLDNLCSYDVGEQIVHLVQGTRDHLSSMFSDVHSIVKNTILKNSLNFFTPEVFSWKYCAHSRLKPEHDRMTSARLWYSRKNILFRQLSIESGEFESL